jgi:DNA-binding LytR/AlgR family response regulator
MENNASEIRLRCIAVDDEPFARKLIADDITKVPFLDLVTTCHSASDALPILSTGDIDLMFLDIQMPVIRGTDFLRTLDHPPMVIITTAFESFALEGFELNVIDYLVKPIPFERFIAAVNKAREQFRLRKIEKEKTADKQFIFVHSEYKQIRIPIETIRYIEGLKDYVKVYLTTQTKPVLTRLNLKAIEAKLPAGDFCRIHNSFIVSIGKINSVQRSQVFIGQDVIPVGDKYSEAFQKKFNPPV